MRERYDTEGHGIELVEIGGGWQILTRPEYTETIERAQLASRPARLSGAALETLAIVAYRQPIGRAEIEEIRGVAVGGMLQHAARARAHRRRGSRRGAGTSAPLRHDAGVSRAVRAATSGRAASRRRARGRAACATARAVERR